MRLRMGPGAQGFVLGALMAGFAVATIGADGGWDRAVAQDQTLTAPPAASGLTAAPLASSLITAPAAGFLLR